MSVKPQTPRIIRGSAEFWATPQQANERNYNTLIDEVFRARMARWDIRSLAQLIYHDSWEWYHRRPIKRQE